MKRLISLVTALSMAFMLLPVFAPDVLATGVGTSENIEDDGYVVAGVTQGVEAKSGSPYEISIGEVIENSENVVYSGTTVVGTFTSEKYDAGLLGYKYSISFDWKASLNASGDYYFALDGIDNVELITHTNYLILGLAWQSYTYSVTKFTYALSNARSVITFQISYKFTVYPKDALFGQVFTANHEQSYTMSEVKDH